LLSPSTKLHQIPVSRLTRCFIQQATTNPDTAQYPAYSSSNRNRQPRIIICPV
jgi:hypothetical protein